MHRLLYILFALLLPQGAQAQQQQQPYSLQHLATAIQQYEQLARQQVWQHLPDTLLLRPGDTSRFVLPLRHNLLLTGDLALTPTVTDSVYSPTITKAVKLFQKRHGLRQDGIVGPNTLQALNTPLSERLRQLRLNYARLDTSRMRSIQEPYVVINLPEYRLQVQDSNKTVLDMNVIIGKETWPTYPVHSVLDMVVLHPYWYIPRSIAIGEIAPILRRNPGYLYRKNMRLEQKTAAGWVRVNPWRVDWHSIGYDNYNYRMVQLQGEQNELGQVKFPFPNRLAQYLHDTPHKALFSYPRRAFSHGCIRLEKPVELAYYLLRRGSGYTTKQVDKQWLRFKPNHYLRVKEPLPLHIIYLTAWADAQGLVHFREDIYGLIDAAPPAAEQQAQE